MRKFRLAILGSSPCHLCIAACCKQNGHEYSVLLEPTEYGRFGPFAVEFVVQKGNVRAVERVLPYRHGRCVFLGHDDRCTVYENRPTSCRRFECITGFHHGGGDCSSHSRFLKRNPNVLALLESELETPLVKFQ